jgi:hypothetical protein
VEEIVQRYGISKVTAYADLKIVKSLLPNLSEASRDYHRWRYNEMILETYQMAKKRKDTKTMEKAATSYAKYNRIDVEDETAVPYHMIVVQPFFPTTDPRVVGINPVPNIDERIKKLTKELVITEIGQAFDIHNKSLLAEALGYDRAKLTNILNGKLKG